MFDLYAENQILRTFSSPYNPTANSVSERLNTRIAEALIILKGLEISEIIHRLKFSFNHSYHRALQYSPHEVNSNNSIFDPIKRQTNSAAQNFYLNPKKASEKTLEIENKQPTSFVYGHGVYVFVKKLRVSKLDKPWLGMYPILQINSSGNVVEVDMNEKTVWVNIKLLISCNPLVPRNRQGESRISQPALLATNLESNDT